MKIDLSRKDIQRHLGSVTKLAKNTLINYDAYLQADAERKKLDLAKFRQKIKANMSDDSDDNNNADDDLGNDKNVY